MRLKPFEEEKEEYQIDPIQRSINEALSITGIKKGKSAKLELDEIRNVFDAAGVGIEDVAQTVGGLMRSSEKDETRLRCAELALKVQGVFKDMDDKVPPVINITVEGSGNQTLIELVCPR